MTLPRSMILLFALAPILAACGEAPAEAQAPTSPTAPPIAEAPAAAAEPEAAPMALTEAADVSALFGTWAANTDWCAGGGEGSPITISATRFEGRENVCAIETLENNGDGSWTAAISCQGEGQTAEENIRMSPEGTQLALTYVDRGGAEVTLNRCE